MPVKNGPHKAYCFKDDPDAIHSSVKDEFDLVAGKNEFDLASWSTVAMLASWPGVPLL
jgi:hypothetical protein